MNFPQNLLYSKDHEWILLDGTTATVGITDFAQRELGDIVFVEVDSDGSSLQVYDTFGSVEAVKTVSDLFAPVAGVITEVNPNMTEAPETVNTDPYGAGWMVKMSVAADVDTSHLMSSEAYIAMLGE